MLQMLALTSPPHLHSPAQLLCPSGSFLCLLASVVLSPSLPSRLSVILSPKTYLEAELDQDPRAQCAMDVSRPHPLHKDPQPSLEL